MRHTVRQRLDPGPPQRWELHSSASRICRASQRLMRQVQWLRAAGVSRHEIGLALSALGAALDAQRRGAGR